ncbi:unnamed protein product [Prunus armeniaca]|uniref:Leucine-rich repeat-containing N-terminal plant-type domain-containing protein n=1 Tax=Prunus armeniaca TaxID=36596 RepID=A0A6J5VAI1_PRUAR|nr:unnamed protein product [Prunus armeniaca]
MKTLLHYLFLLCFNILLPAVQSQCIKDQQQSLLHLKKSLQFDQPSYSTKVISGIQAPTVVLGSLFHLQHLQSLNLADNDFDYGTSIPSAIGKLVKLRYLNLSYNNGYSGKIPIEISSLTRLVVLDISLSFHSLEAPNISILFQNLTELAELYFDGVYLRAQGANWSQAISSSLPNLRVLSLFRTGLSDPFDQSLAKLQSLSVIRLGGFFANFSNLRVLDLSWNSISGPIPGSLANFSNLKVLNLSGNSISGPIPGLFAKFSNLRELDLRQNNISGPIPGFFANFSNLRVLDLSWNSISGPIPGSFENFSNLRMLGLSWNNISGPIPGFFANFSKLTSLRLSGCRLNGTFPNEIFQVPTLQTIDLSANFKLGGSLPEFPKKIGSLQSLSLSKTNFSGSLPDSIGNLKMLSTIDLSNCSFHGSIPSSLFSLPLLSQLNLSHNQFSGELAFLMSLPT